MGIINRKTGERKYVGEIISERGTFRMDMSMDELVIWDTKEQCPRTEYLCGYDWYLETSGEDLSEKNKIEYESYCKDLKEKNLKRAQERFNKALKKGEEVKVTKGRKVPIGTIGMVFFIKKTTYGAKIGIITKDETKYYTYLGNLERASGIEFNEAYDDFEQEYVC